MRIILISLVLVLSACNQCQNHVLHLMQLFATDKAKFLMEVHGYVLYSGKMADDLGLPESCLKYDNYRYFTGELIGISEEVKYRGYLGVCFSEKCSTSDMDVNAATIIKQILNVTIPVDARLAFREPSLSIQVKPIAVIFVCLFGLLIAASLKESVFTFFKSCVKEAKKEDEDLYGKYSVQFGDDYDPTLLVINQDEDIFKKLCLKQKLHEYFQGEQSSKIIAFSAFRILAVPLALYGYLFYLCNISCYNYTAFAEELYETSFSKAAVAAYYIPDSLFFMSGFLLARKGFSMLEVEQKPQRVVFRVLKDKLVRWVPLYWAFIVIYWLISPSLHAGPIWYEYQQSAAVCNSAWWRVLLFIDNWFEDGCYNFAWFISAQIQLSILCAACIILIGACKSIGVIVVVLMTVATWILTLTLSAPFPSSLDTTLNFYSQKYFKETYSHMPYYLFGVINGFLAADQKTKDVMKNLTTNKFLRVGAIVIGVVLMVLVVIRPSVWYGELSFELGLAKTGMFLAVYFMMFWTMFGGQVVKTSLHRVATLSKGVLLMGGIVVSSYFWAGYTLPYLDKNYLFGVTIANLLISIPAGILVTALIWPRPPKEEQMLL